jgi:hypothetical protein
MMNILSFGSDFLSILTDFTLLDPDPGSQLNADSKHWKKRQRYFAGYLANCMTQVSPGPIPVPGLT